MSRYRLTPEAARDLGEIIAFIVNDNPSGAADLVGRLQGCCKWLGELPDTGRRRDELAPNLRSFAVDRYVTFYRYVIFYRPDDEGIQIIRILHGSRDIPKLFE